MMESLTPEEKKTLIVWAIVGIIIFLFILGYSFIYLDSKEKLYVDEEYKIVKNYDRYYTVMGTINKFYAFYNAKSYESVLHILNSNYVKENSITLDNIREFFPEVKEFMSYNGKIMCSKNLDKGITSYIIEGNETKMNTGEIVEKKYYNVILDGNEFVFSIEPIDEEFYGGNCNG